MCFLVKFFGLVSKAQDLGCHVNGVTATAPLIYLRYLVMLQFLLTNIENLFTYVFQLAIDYGIKFLETSAKSSINVEEVRDIGILFMSL